MAQAIWTLIRRASNGTCRVWIYDGTGNIRELHGQEKAEALQMSDHGRRIHDTPGPATPVASVNAGL